MTIMQIDSIWLVTREFAGIAESGGLKNVAKGLAKELANFKIKTSVFIPLYGCTSNYNEIKQSGILFTVNINAGERSVLVNFYTQKKNGIDFIFIDAEIFSEKKNIYTYTQDEAFQLHEKSQNNIFVKKGEGYIDSNYMNIFFQKAVLEFAAFKNEAPSIMHCQDAHTAFLPALIFNNEKTAFLFKNTKCFITIHNAGNGYRQKINYGEAKFLTGLNDEVLQFAKINGFVEPFLAGAKYASLTTVSPWYAGELKDENIPDDSIFFSKEFAQNLIAKKIDITGITNGISFDAYNPKNKNKSLLPFSFEIEKEKIEGKYLCRDFFIKEFCETQKNKTAQMLDGVELIGSLNINPCEKYLFFFYHGRIAEQKGIQTLNKVIPQILEKYKNARFIISGQGSEPLENQCISLAEKNRGNCLFIKGYNKSLIRLATASCDFILLPSLFEPCGMEDFIGQIYGCIPIANAIGGLNKIQDGKTGFLYRFDIKREPAFHENGEDVHQKKLCQIIEEHCKNFFEGNYKRVLDSPFYFGIIENAQKIIKENFLWKNIVENHYLELYCRLPDQPSFERSAL